MENKMQKDSGDVFDFDTVNSARNGDSGVNDADDSAKADAETLSAHEGPTETPEESTARTVGQDPIEAAGNEDLANKESNGEAVSEQDNSIESLREELKKMKAELEEKTRQCSEFFERLQRTAAEFDNFKKRTAKEKEMLYVDAVADVVSAFLPVIDNVERAMQAISGKETTEIRTLKEGVEMIYKQFKETLKNIGIEEIKALNEQFNPTLHNAVMHVEDDKYGHNIIIEEFQKGYIYKDRVIRYSMVKVAN